MLPYQRLGGFAPQISLLVIATYTMRIMHFTSVKVTWRLLDNSSFPLASIDTGVGRIFLSTPRLVRKVAILHVSTDMSK